MKYAFALALLAVLVGQAAPALAAATKCKSITSQSTCNNTGKCLWHTKKGICYPK
jgi:hypothetical protein